VKEEYWYLSDDQLVGTTGKPVAHWMALLDEYFAENKKSAAARFLQKVHGVPRHWANTLLIRYRKVHQKKPPAG